MRKLILSIFIVVFIFNESKAQLKENNYLIIDKSNVNIKVSTADSDGFKFLSLIETRFKYQKDLTFYYSPNFPSSYCCNYYEVKAIPKNWNIITVKDIVAYMEDKKNYFNFMTKKLFFVEYDKERRMYKAYQVDIIGWPRTD
jgi:hypothetical protein